MEEKRRAYTCLLVIGSMTQAIRAQRALAAATVPCEVVKVDSSQTGRGCAYGVSLSCLQTERAEMLLRAGGIRVRARLEDRWR